MFPCLFDGRVIAYKKTMNDNCSLIQVTDWIDKVMVLGKQILTS